MGATVTDSPSSLPHRPHSHNVFTPLSIALSLSQSLASISPSLTQSLHHSQTRLSFPIAPSTSLSLKPNRLRHYPRNAQINGFKRESSKNLTFGGDNDDGEA